jgi:uncharacterized surface protein with fasciclin (FAS1) repeats
VTILAAADLAHELSEPGAWLVLSPTDDAFARLPPRSVDTLLARGSAETLVDLAERHVARDGGDAPRLRRSSFLSLLGTRIAIDESLVVAETARVVEWRTCVNGVIGVIDRVLVASPSAAHPAQALGTSLPLAR